MGLLTYLLYLYRCFVIIVYNPIPLRPSRSISVLVNPCPIFHLSGPALCGCGVVVYIGNCCGHDMPPYLLGTKYTLMDLPTLCWRLDAASVRYASVRFAVRIPCFPPFRSRSFVEAVGVVWVWVWVWHPCTFRSRD